MSGQESKGDKGTGKTSKLFVVFGVWLRLGMLICKLQKPCVCLKKCATLFGPSVQGFGPIPAQHRLRKPGPGTEAPFT
jgi:hypothetical protein